MKTGIAVSTFPAQFGPIVLTGDDLAGNLSIAKELGYQGIDLFMNNKTEPEIEEICLLFEELGLQISMLAAIYLAEKGVNFSDPDEEKRKRSVEEYKEQILVAQRLRAKTMPVGFIRGNMQEGDTKSSYQQRLAASMCEIVAFAAGKGIDICLEPINRYEMETFPRVGETLEFIGTYHIDGLKILPDFFHMNIEEASMEDALRMAGDKIGHMHVTDSNRLAPGQGHLDYRSLLGVLQETGYDGYLSVEAFPEPNARECARQGAAYLHHILGHI